jgi:hypothetical protein
MAALQLQIDELKLASAASLVLVAMVVLRLSSKIRVWRKKLPESCV